MPFNYKTIGGKVGFALKVRYGGRQIWRAINHRNLSLLGIALPESIPIDSKIAYEAERRVKELAKKGSFDHPIFQISGNNDRSISLADAINRHIDSQRAKNVSRKILVLKKYFLQSVGSINIADLRHEHIDRFIKFLMSRPFSADTVWQYAEDLKSFLLWLKKNKYLEDDLSESISIKRKKPSAVYLREDQIHTLLNNLQGGMLETAVRLVLNTGARRGELVRIKWSDIDFDRKLVFLDGTKTENAKRFVPLFDRLASYLRKLTRRSEYVLCSGERQATVWALSTALRRFKARFDLGFDWDLQTLRKSYGAMLLKNGFQLWMVSNLIGHSDVQTTERWYVHITNDDVIGSVAAIPFTGF